MPQSRVPSQPRRSIAAVDSQALHAWRTTSSRALDELVAAHASLCSARRRHRQATAHVNAALVVQIAAHFQLFARNLHTEAAELLLLSAPSGYRPMLRASLTERRSLDRGNATARAIARDFDRFDLDIWRVTTVRTSRTVNRRWRLDQLMAWRNAIAHQDFTFTDAQAQLLEGTALTLAWAHRWRNACDRLAETFDSVTSTHVRSVTNALHP